MMLECEHCGRWRLLYCQRKLTRKERESLEEVLADISFTCEVSLQELELPGKLANVYVRDISCQEPIKRLYYTAKYPPICAYCAHSMSDTSDSKVYPQCPSCGDKPKIPKSYNIPCVLSLHPCFKVNTGVVVDDLHGLYVEVSKMFGFINHLEQRIFTLEIM